MGYTPLWNLTFGHAAALGTQPTMIHSTATHEPDIADGLVKIGDSAEDPAKFLRPSKRHSQCNVEDHPQTEVGDPAVFMQQAGNKARGDAHQEDRQAETKNEDHGVLACGARHSQYIVE